MPARLSFATPGRPVVIAFADRDGDTAAGSAAWALALLPEVQQVLPEWPLTQPEPLAEADPTPATVQVERRAGPDGRWLYEFRYPGPPGDRFEVEGALAAGEAIAGALTLCFTQQDRRALQVHAAALALPRGLLVLHGATMAGKSSLAVHGAVLGVPLAADDRLVLSVSPDGLVEATALGVAPRLRKPLPPDAGADFVAFVGQRVQRDFDNVQRLRLARPLEQLAAGTRLPVLGLVTLERRPRGAIEFAPQGQGAALKALFDVAAAPHLDPETTTRRLAKIIRRVPGYRLAFANSRDTARLLVERFGGG
jgi:hypothetical protein